ncbi:MAG: hypothetical protein MUO76_16035 [Anaerolineaceae bacterium]|nr:hypothetical protein [Anaerolineaceae bacterium]
MTEPNIYLRIKHILVFLLLVLTGCSSVQVVEVVDVAPQTTLEEKELNFQIFDIRNCQNKTSELKTTLAAVAPVRQQIVFEGKAISTDSGDSIDIPPNIQTQLEAKIENEYKQAYQQAKSNAEQVDLIIPPFGIRMYEVQWMQQVASSTIDFEMEGQSFTTAFTYQLEFPTLVGFREMACTA